ncbi:hypothetical protein [Flavobacterium sp.]|uniref:hypothetical protein n=1 Tax=Flavobacterium sp. TaxID=239 RepID=UPI00403497F0
MKNTFYIINYTYFICVGILLLFTSLFYLGGKEQMQAQLADRWTFIFARIVFNEAVLFIFLLFLFVMDLAFSRSVNLKTRLRLVLKAFLWLSLFSLVFITLYYAFR